MFCSNTVYVCVLVCVRACVCVCVCQQGSTGQPSGQNEHVEGGSQLWNVCWCQKVNFYSQPTLFTRPCDPEGIDSIDP